MEETKCKPNRKYVLRKGYRTGTNGISCEMSFANPLVYSDNSITQRIRIRRDGGMTYTGVEALLPIAIKHSEEWLESLGHNKENWRSMPSRNF